MKSLPRACALITVLALQLGSATAMASERFQPGNWQAVTRVDGKTAGKQPPRCVAAADTTTMNGTADEIRKALAASPDWQGCALSDVRADGDQVDFTASCGGGIVTTSRTTYRGTSYSSVVTVSSAGRIGLAMAIEGTRVGNCP
ncbi:DUF3617 family protein [Xanthobacter sp. V4C-4]|uniref:DUF3617 domain-containing protein n=1 Tax=Xanthobacter cornucopiae TaxID=3119924 RepID=UPI00372BBE20